MSTGIIWTDEVWNPTTGCTKVSAGCKNCYAERMAKRLAGRYGYPADKPFAVTLHPERLDDPLRWKKPQRIFVDSMSDLFHKDVPDEFIDRVFSWMGIANWHTFQVLTKRPERMASYLAASATPNRVLGMMNARGRVRITSWPALGHNEWPLPNVWLGTSVENQQTANERIPLLLQTPAAVRWVSAEPLLGPVDLGELTWANLPGAVRGDGPWPSTIATRGIHRAHMNQHGAVSVIADNGQWLGVKPREMDWCRKLDWVVVGGESGPGARPMHPDWARSLRDQCVAAGVPLLFKQWGEWYVPDDGAPACRVCGCTDLNGCDEGCWWIEDDLCSSCEGKETPVGGDRPVKFRKVGKKQAGRLLDGVLHDEHPEVHDDA